MSHQTLMSAPSAFPLQQQQKRSASADDMMPSAPRGASAVPPKKRARNQQEQEEEGESALDGDAVGPAPAAAVAAAPLDLSAPGRGRASREPEPPSHQAPPDAASSSAGAAAAAVAAAAYMSRCAETLRAMGIAPPTEDPADSWLAMGHWQASLHAQYLYYSSLALSGLLPPQHAMVGAKAQQPQSQAPPPPPQPMLLSPSFAGLFSHPAMPPPSLPPLPPMQPPPPPSQTSSSTSSSLSQPQPLSHHRPIPAPSEEPHSPAPARRLPTPQSPPQPHHQQPHQHQTQHQNQHQQTQQRRVKSTKPAAPPFTTATIAAASATASVIVPKASPTLLQVGASAAAPPERQSSGETDFQCSCSRAFASLIGLTLHLKETGHGPGAGYSRDRDIPKLVRGQDMWINSETEQTREILRCIRCKQSFRTLPELTMHMMKTRHYTEIIYTDSGAPSQQAGGVSTASAAAAAGMRLPAAAGHSGAKEPPAAAVSGKERPPPAQHHRSVRTEVKEADSATDPQQQQQQQQQQQAGVTSTLQKMQHFVEASLPRSALRRPAMFQEVLQNSVFDAAGERIAGAGDSDNEDDQQLREDPGAPGRRKGTPGGDHASYLSPDRPTDPKENPLSSLQKLVDTAEKTSAAAAASLTVTTSTAAAAAATACAPASAASASATAVSSAVAAAAVAVSRPMDHHRRDGSPTECAAGAGSACAGSGNRHTVIMLSPTYIYPGGMYPPFPVCHPSALLAAGSGAAGGVGPMDLSNITPAKHHRPEEASSVTPRKPSGASGSAGGGGVSGGEQPLPDKAVGWPDSLMQKKAKCHYCSKPFANKGQVRLHVSKGKCPSLLARLPTAAALPPFPFFPAMDYIKAAGRFHPAATGAPASGKELQA